MGGACGWLGKDEKCIQNFVGKREGKRPFGMPRHRWKNNIRTELRETGCEDVDWKSLAQHRDQ
jgi:hypothetical protein